MTKGQTVSCHENFQQSSYNDFEAQIATFQAHFYLITLHSFFVKCIFIKTRFYQVNRGFQSIDVNHGLFSNMLELCMHYYEVKRSQRHLLPPVKKFDSKHLY